MIPYLVYVALITAICFLFYRLLLHRETFFQLNRWFFLCCLIASFTLPLLHIPQTWSARSNTPVEFKTKEEEKIDFKEPYLRPGNLAVSDPARVPNNRTIETVPSLPASTLPSPSLSKSISPVQPHMDIVSAVLNFGLLKCFYYLYLIGAAFLGAMLLVQIMILIYQVRSNPVIEDGPYRIVQTRGKRGPCSFGRYIFINSSLYDEETLQQILLHEKIHVRQRHSLDIILAEMYIVVQWFNPFVWLYRKALENNLEFLTDAAIIRNPVTNASSYQMSLLRVSAPHLPLSITSNYNQSLLKKRIIMMHIQKSTIRTTWKYIFLFPLLSAVVCIFNDTAAVSQNININKIQPQNSIGVATERPIISEQEISAKTNITASKASGQTLSAVNYKSSIGDTDIRGTGLQIALTDVNVQTVVDPQVKINVDAIVSSPSVNINLNIDRPDQRKGTWMATLKSDTVELTLRSEEGDGYRGYSTNTEWIMKSEFSTLPTGQKADFTVVREAGTLFLNGVFDGDEGFGHYSFKENTDFQHYLEKIGVTGVTDRRMFGVFFANVTKRYIDDLTQAGYSQLSINNLIGLSSVKVDKAYIASWKQLGYPDLQAHDLIALKSMNIDGDYLKELEKAGFSNLPPHEIITAKSVGINGAYAQSWKQAGFADLPIHDLVSAKSVGLDPSYSDGWKQAGFNDLSIHELVSAKSVGIDPAYAQSWKQAGFADLSIHDLISVKSVGLDPGYADSWKQAGFNDLSIHDLVSAKSTGITTAYAESWKQSGYKDFSIHELISLKSVGVDGSYVQSWKTMGYSDLSVHELISLKSVGVTSVFLKEMENVGYSHLAPHELISFKSVGVTPAFVQGFQMLGFKDIPAHIIVELKSMGITPGYISSMKAKGFNSGDLQEYIKLKTFRSAN
jgi:BlaR1 peptidase M56